MDMIWMEIIFFKTSSIFTLNVLVIKCYKRIDVIQVMG